MKIVYAITVAVVASLSIPTIATAQEYSSCPDPNMGFQEYKTQLADCMSDAGRKISNQRLDRLLQDEVNFTFGITVEALPAPNTAKNFSQLSVMQEGLKYRDIARLVAAQPNRIYGIHKSLLDNIEKMQLEKVALPAPYEVLEAQIFGSFAQTLSLVGQSTFAANTESEASKVQKVDSAEGEGKVSSEKTKSTQKADEKVEPTGSEQVASPSSVGAAASGGNTIYAIAGGLGVAAAAGGGGGGGSSCPDIYSTYVSVVAPSNFDEAASADITVSSSIALCVPITVTLSFSGEAVAGTDFQSNTTTEIAAGQTSGSISLTAIDDNLYEGNEAISVAMTFVADDAISDDNIIGTQSRSLVLLDNEAQPTISLSTSATSIDEKLGSATLTATASGAADENMVVTLSGSGTAGFNLDYNLGTLITIAAGSLTGTATLTSIDDTSYETTQAGVAEIANVSIASVTIGAENGSQSVSISITERALNSGTQLTYNLTDAESRRTSQEFVNFNAAGAASVQNPLELINAHKAHGYGLDGSGETVMVMDSCMNTSHADLSDTTFTTYGSVDTCSGGGYHGATVAGVIAADAGDGNTGLVGVAPGVGITHADYGNTTNTGAANSTTFAEKWALATTYANNNNIIVQNNSWGPSDTPISTVVTNILNNGTSAAEEVAADWRSGFFGANASDAAGVAVQTYVNELDDYQQNGVVVFALSNNAALSDADVIAALPVLFTELNEAWITAVNVEITGGAGSETYIRKSAPCGQTAAYCLGADAWEIAGLANNNLYVGSTGGTSFVAPMISGAVAILGEAFPNHTPEQLVDRLLASADNSWFTPDANTTFANGVVHGYNTEFGHGILDIYAALQPITSNSNVRSMRVYSGQSNLNQPSNSFGRTALRSSRSFGDGIQNALAGTNSFVYDDMNGGFSYDLSGHITQSEHVAKSIDLSSELYSLNMLNSH